MKLRNKKTGKIINSNELLTDEFMIDLFSKDFNYFNSKLGKICEEWEDYEENKYYYAITSIKFDNGITKMKNIHNDMTAFDKAIGNYFETKEEAEKAVEKLKAWKRLKDKCCISFSGINRNIKGRPVSVNLDFNNEGKTTFDEAKQNIDDLMLLFGGENESKE